MMTMFPGQTQDDELDARRFADALDLIDAGEDPGIDPIEDPELVSLLATTREARASWGSGRPRDSYRTRSRALLMSAYAEEYRVPDVARLEEARARRRLVPFFLRPAFLAPIASAAAAAAITLGFAIAGETVGGSGDRSSVLAFPVDSNSPSTVLAVPTEEPNSVANLTSQSAIDELDRIQVALREIAVHTQQGQPVDPSLLRAVTQGTVNVANRIESSPDAVPEQVVVTYIEAAGTSRTLLDGAEVDSANQAALDAARQAAQDGVEVASRYFLMRSQ